MLTLADFTRDDVGSQRLKFGSTFLRFLGSQNCLAFLTFPYPLPVPKNCIIFVGCNFKSRASQVGLHKQKKDTASAKKGKASLDKTQGCALDLTAQDLAPWTWLGDWKYCLAGPAGRLAGVGFLIYSQKVRMSRIYYLRNRSLLDRFALRSLSNSWGRLVACLSKSFKKMLLNRAAGTRWCLKVVSRKFTCNRILDYERDKLHSFR